MDIPRIFNITESAHRIHNPIIPDKLATFGAALRLESGARVLDLGSGLGEMLCIWARDHGVIGTGIDSWLCWAAHFAELPFNPALTLPLEGESQKVPPPFTPRRESDTPPPVP